MLVLYTIARQDLDTMGRGRMAAQVAHAANQFTDRMIIAPLLANTPPDTDAMAWRAEAEGFGTQIVLAAKSLADLEALVAQAKADGFSAGLLVDPEYFVPDGTTGHLVRDVPTVAWVFGDKTALTPLLGSFSLLANDPIPR